MFVETAASGAEISTIIERLEPAFEGLPKGHVIIACLTIVATIMKPDIEPDDLVNVVKEMSRTACEFLDDGLGGPPLDIPREMMN